MADNGVNKGRRRFLVGATSVVGAVGAVGVAVPLWLLGSLVPKQERRVLPFKQIFPSLSLGSV